MFTLGSLNHCIYTLFCTSLPLTFVPCFRFLSPGGKHGKNSKTGKKVRGSGGPSEVPEPFHSVRYHIPGDPGYVVSIHMFSALSQERVRERVAFA